jgi:hypothetical protein
VRNAAVKNTPATSRRMPAASREKAARAFETTPPFLREERLFGLEDPFAYPPDVLRPARFFVAM